MIPRYSRCEMLSIWEDSNKYKIWLEIERHACEAQSKLGVIPDSVRENFKKQIEEFDVKRIDEIESVVKHDVIAFLTYVAEYIDLDIRYLHYGMTSSDVLDTCLSVQLRKSADILLDDMERLLLELKVKANDTKYALCIGRSHGVHAEPMTFGLKMARFYAEFERSYERLKNAREEVSVCKISGAMGNFAHIDPAVEDHVAQSMGLRPEIISSQVIPRDRHAMFFATLGVIAGSIENVATEIRHLQRTEVLEVAECFSVGQKGSSAMPHKKNPIFSENLTGLARLIRSYVTPAMENIALWHERDISHSSVERCIAPDACIALDFALIRLTGLVKDLVISSDAMQNNIELSRGLVFSQRVLLELINRGLSREDAYKIVQDNAKSSWENNSDFLAELTRDELLSEYMKTSDLYDLFDFSYYTKHVDTIFKRVFDVSDS